MCNKKCKIQYLSRIFKMMHGWVLHIFSAGWFCRLHQISKSWGYVFHRVYQHNLNKINLYNKFVYWQIKENVQLMYYIFNVLANFFENLLIEDDFCKKLYIDKMDPLILYILRFMTFSNIWLDNFVVIVVDYDYIHKYKNNQMKFYKVI